MRSAGVPRRKTLLSWSSGKDSAWALHVLRGCPDIEVVGLFCTVNQDFDRVAMHAVKTELVRLQAERAGLPLHIIPIPHPCDNGEYQQAMQRFITEARGWEIECVAFGDLFLQDVRDYRVQKMQGTGITPIFPLWGIATASLARQMVDSDLRAVITCVDPRQLSPELIGHEFDHAFLDRLPDTVDPCGENGEFHSFVYAGVMFRQPIDICVGEVVERDGFVYADISRGGTR